MMSKTHNLNCSHSECSTFAKEMTRFTIEKLPVPDNSICRFGYVELPHYEYTQGSYPSNVRDDIAEILEKNFEKFHRGVKYELDNSSVFLEVVEKTNNTVAVKFSYRTNLFVKNLIALQYPT
jgi:hypothetical protein